MNQCKSDGADWNCRRLLHMHTRTCLCGALFDMRAAPFTLPGLAWGPLLADSPRRYRATGAGGGSARHCSRGPAIPSRRPSPGRGGGGQGRRGSDQRVWEAGGQPAWLPSDVLLLIPLSLTRDDSVSVTDLELITECACGDEAADPHPLSERQYA